MRRQRGECARSSDIALKLKVVRKWTAIKSCATLFTRLKDTIRNLAKYWNILREERGSRNWHPRSERQSIYQAREAENPEWPSARREGRKEERVARKMTINNWYNAASRRPPRRRRRSPPLGLPNMTSTSFWEFVDPSPSVCKNYVQGGCGCRTGNGKKLSNSQACCLAQLCLAAA